MPSRCPSCARALLPGRLPGARVCSRGFLQGFARPVWARCTAAARAARAHCCLAGIPAPGSVPEGFDGGFTHQHSPWARCKHAAELHACNAAWQTARYQGLLQGSLGVVTALRIMRMLCNLHDTTLLGPKRGLTGMGVPLQNSCKRRAQLASEQATAACHMLLPQVCRGSGRVGAVPSMCVGPRIRT